MKVRTAFAFTEGELRTIRAAVGRGGMATRKECVTFIDRAVRLALDKAPDPKPARRRAPKPVPEPPRPEPDEGTKERETRERLRRLYKLTGGAAGRAVVGEP